MNQSTAGAVYEGKSGRGAANELFFRPNTPTEGIGVTAMRGGTWALVAQVVYTTVRMSSSIVLAHLLVPADFGLYAMVVAVLSGLLIFKDLGLPDAIIQSPTVTVTQVSSLFWVNLGINLAVVLGLVAFSPVLSGFFSERRVTGIVAVWSFTIVFGALSAQHLALLKRAMFFSSISKLSMVAAIISNVGAIILAWKGAGYWALVLREVMNEAVVAAGAWFLCQWRPQRPSRHPGIRPMLVFGGQSTVAFIIRRTTRNLDRTLLGWRFGPVVTGRYHNAFELAAMVTSFVAEPLRNVAVSSLSKLRKQPARFRQHYLKALSLVAFVSFGATAVLVAMGDDIVALFLGPKWQGSGHILQILGISAGISAIYATNVWLHFSLGHVARMSRWTIVDAVLLAAGVTAGLRSGATGVAWGYSASMCIVCVTGLWYAGRPIGLTLGDMLAVLWRPAVAAGVAGGLCWNLVFTTGFVQVHAARIVLFLGSFGCIYICLVIVMSGGIKTFRSYLNLMKKCLPAGSYRAE